ncbi:hypothetical protein [Nocardia tengchongensis]|uniref:hypothetical protein n=1 Tax=Nocardia tengchongensis TaxID=2055889 RepID=UPI00364B87D8
MEITMSNTTTGVCQQCQPNLEFATRKTTYDAIGLLAFGTLTGLISSGLVDLNSSLVLIASISSVAIAIWCLLELPMDWGYRKQVMADCARHSNEAIA